ncbi:hypothetical protein DMENIID0001_024340 [Sergentomyia squamirostris]
MKRYKPVRFFKKATPTRRGFKPKPDELSAQKLTESQESEEVFLKEHSFADDEDNIESLEEEYEEDPVKEEYIEEETDALASGEPNLRTDLANLVKKTNASDAFTDNLLKLLRRSGHTDLPANKTSLVNKPKPNPMKQNDDAILNTILDNQKTILKEQKLILEQLKAVNRSDACLKMRILDLSAKVEKIRNVQAIGDFAAGAYTTPLHVYEFPCNTLDEFVKFDNSLEEEEFQTSLFPQMDSILSSSTWLFEIMNDDVLLQYNLNGNHQKRCLRTTKLFQLLKARYCNHIYLEDQHIQALVKQSHQRKQVSLNRARKKLQQNHNQSGNSQDDSF